jgi:hypothetical protein
VLDVEAIDAADRRAGVVPREGAVLDEGTGFGPYIQAN